MDKHPGAPLLPAAARFINKPAVKILDDVGAVEGGVVQADAQVAQGPLSPPQGHVVVLAPLVVLQVLLEGRGGEVVRKEMY